MAGFQVQTEALAKSAPDAQTAADIAFVGLISADQAFANEARVRLAAGSPVYNLLLAYRVPKGRAAFLWKVLDEMLHRTDEIDYVRGLISLASRSLGGAGGGIANFPLRFDLNPRAEAPKNRGLIFGLTVEIIRLSPKEGARLWPALLPLGRHAARELDERPDAPMAAVAANIAFELSKWLTPGTPEDRAGGLCEFVVELLNRALPVLHEASATDSDETAHVAPIQTANASYQALVVGLRKCVRPWMLARYALPLVTMADKARYAVPTARGMVGVGAQDALYSVLPSSGGAAVRHALAVAALDPRGRKLEILGGLPRWITPQGIGYPQHFYYLDVLNLAAACAADAATQKRLRLAREQIQANFQKALRVSQGPGSRERARSIHVAKQWLKEAAYPDDAVAKALCDGDCDKVRTALGEHAASFQFALGFHDD